MPSRNVAIPDPLCLRKGRITSPGTVRSKQYHEDLTTTERKMTWDLRSATVDLYGFLSVR